jgi:4-hydroxybenzoate polyprenyltransferase
MNRLLPYLRLLRVGNMFTAWADVLAAQCVAQAVVGSSADALLVLASSTCLYCGGMALNDLLDLPFDRQYHPRRPLPSGQISVKSAAMLTGSLFLGGLLGAALAGGQSFCVAALLLLFILAYDAGGKRTFLGPLLMGLCRALNFALGLSAVEGALAGFPWAAAPSGSPHGVFLAAALGMYVMGVTRYAQREATQPRRLELLSATLGMNLALILVLMIGLLAQRDPARKVITEGQHLRKAEKVQGDTWATDDVIRYRALWVGATVWINGAAGWGLVWCRPSQVQQAVRFLLLGIIWFDAAAVGALHGWTTGAPLLLLLVPAYAISRWIPAT